MNGPTFMDFCRRSGRRARLQGFLTQNKDRISATTNWSKAVAETDITMIIIPTPSGADGAFHNDHVLSAIDEIGSFLARKPDYHLVVVNSTTMPGSVGVRERLEQASSRKVGPHLGLCYNPEIHRARRRYRRPAPSRFPSLSARAMGRQAICSRKSNAKSSSRKLTNAVLTKISVNTYVTMKIYFANMLGEICDWLVGADAAVVADALGRDTRIGVKYLRPAIGYGGPCFPRDTIAFGRVADVVGRVADLALATDQINRRQVARLSELVSGSRWIDHSAAIHLGVAGTARWRPR